MKNTILFRRTLWANVVFAEAGAIATLFLYSFFPVIGELTNGMNLAMGIELLLVAGLLTVAALRKTIARPVAWLIVGSNVLFLVFLLERMIFGASLSGLALEILAVEAVATAVLIYFQTKAIRTEDAARRTMAA